MKEWKIPDYRYDRETTLTSLFETFLKANEDNLAHFAREVGVSEDTAARWRAGDLTAGLTSRYKRIFEEMTRISLERLYVIIAWRNILKNLKAMTQRSADVPYARLLLRDPDALRVALIQGKAASYQEGVHRTKIIEVIGAAVRTSGAPLVGLQIGVDTRHVQKWVKDGEQFGLPSGEMLERCLIGIAYGFHTGHPDNVRFEFAADALLGIRYREVIGCGTFEEALMGLLDPYRDRSPTVIANKTGLGVSAVQNLLTYQPKTGNIPFETVVKVIRGLLIKRHPDRVESFDALAQEFVKQAQRGIVNTMPLPFEAQMQPQKPIQSPHEPAPEPLPLPPPPTRSPAKQDDDAILAAAGALIAARAGLDGQLAALCLQYPDTLARLPVPGSQSQASARADEQDIMAVARHLAHLLEQASTLPEHERAELLGRLDPHLVAMQQATEAAGTREPALYLKMVRSGHPADLFTERPHG